MTPRASLALAVLALLPNAQRSSTLRPDPPHECEACAEWNLPRKPFRVFGNTYYVGTAGLGAILLTSDAGHVLLDGGLPQSAPLIDRGVRQLGFRPEEVRLIVNSHAHYDHAGGLAALQRLSGAEVAASATGARAIERGEPTPDDPQFGFGRAANSFPSVAKVRAVADGETLRVGGLAVTAHLTPGHTPGSTTWTWRSCEGARCVDVVYADSLNPVSAPGFRFTEDARTPSRVETFRRTIATVDRLPCEILLTVHPGFSGFDEKLARRARQAEPNPFIDAQACHAYAADAARRLDQRIVGENAPRPGNE